jgi:endonuclease YncB( thermonuclease family)
MKFITPVLILALILIAGCVQIEPKACTEEALICPDGSAVGRVAPDCRFAPCPGCICPEGFIQDGDTCNPACFYNRPPCLMPSVQCSLTRNQTPVCKGNARCFNGTVTKITDGDTLEIDNKPVRLALVDSPEYYQEGYQEAKEFTTSICPIGSTAMIDEDDGQTVGSHNRTIAVVYCNNKNLNEELLINGHAIIDKEFCNTSEFANEEWAKYEC